MWVDGNRTGRLCYTDAQIKFIFCAYWWSRRSKNIKNYLVDVFASAYMLLFHTKLRRGAFL